MRLTWVGHATVRIDVGSAVILTDPLLTRRVVHLRRRVPSPTVVGAVHTVLLSHVHMDHLHRRSLRRLGGARVVAPTGSAALIPASATEIVQVGVGDRVSVPGDVEVAIEVVHAEHFSGRGPHSRVSAAPVGYVVRAHGSSVYFAGDTDLFPAMADIGPIDVALVPIWGWGSSLGERHLDPATAAEAVEVLQARHVVPIHWATYSPVRVGRGAPSWIDRPLALFGDHLAQRGLSDRLVALRPGDSVDVHDGVALRP